MLLLDHRDADVGVIPIAGAEKAGQLERAESGEAPDGQLTDQCLPDALEEASLEKILAVAARAEPCLTALVTGVLERM